MEIYKWNKDISIEEEANGAYWERNMLALYTAVTNNLNCKLLGIPLSCGWYYDNDNNWEGFKRVISLYNGSITYHIPDDFDTGKLEQIRPNWNGHTTEQKYERMMEACGCRIDIK